MCDISGLRGREDNQKRIRSLFKGEMCAFVLWSKVPHADPDRGKTISFQEEHASRAEVTLTKAFIFHGQLGTRGPGGILENVKKLNAQKSGLGKEQLKEMDDVRS